MLKELAPHDLVHEGANAVVPGASSRQNGFDFLPIGKADRRSGGIDRQLLDEVAGDRRLVLEQQLLELPNIGKWPAIEQLCRSDRPRARNET